MNTNEFRTALGLFVSQVLNMLVLLQIAVLSVEQLAGINAVCGSALTLLFYFVKAKPQVEMLARITALEAFITARLGAQALPLEPSAQP